MIISQEQAQELLKAPKPKEARYLTFFDDGLSILELRDAMKGRNIFSDQSWYGDEEFARKKEEPQMRTICMDAWPYSFNMKYKEQLALLPKYHNVPKARQVVMGMALHFLSTGERLFENYYVRCIDKDSCGHIVYVGDFGSVGFAVGRDWDDRRRDYLGLASSVPPRKS